MKEQSAEKEERQRRNTLLFISIEEKYGLVGRDLRFSA